MTDLFAEETIEADQLLPLDENKDYLSELVGEGKKFRDNQALAKAKYHADVTIAERNRSLKELREDYLQLKQDVESRAQIKDLLDRMSKTDNQTETRETNLNANTDNKPDAFDPTKIDELVSKKFQEIETTRKRQDNLSQVDKRLRERYGANAATLLKQKTEELGLSKEFVQDLAERSPSAFYATMGLNEQPSEQFQTPPRNVQRTDSFAPSVPKRTWSYYQNLRKSQPSVYHSQQTQIQMDRDHQELGKAFEDGDFNH